VSTQESEPARREFKSLHRRTYEGNKTQMTVRSCGEGTLEIVRATKSRLKSAKNFMDKVKYSKIGFIFGAAALSLLAGCVG